LVIRRKGADQLVFLDLLAPFEEPLHYLLLLPHALWDGPHHVEPRTVRNSARRAGTEPESS
jgi:hypothetical protein